MSPEPPAAKWRIITAKKEYCQALEALVMDAEGPGEKIL